MPFAQNLSGLLLILIFWSVFVIFIYRSVFMQKNRRHLLLNQCLFVWHCLSKMTSPVYRLQHRILLYWIRRSFWSTAPLPNWNISRVITYYRRMSFSVGVSAACRFRFVFRIYDTFFTVPVHFINKHDLLKNGWTVRTILWLLRQISSEYLHFGPRMIPAASLFSVWLIHWGFRSYRKIIDFKSVQYVQTFGTSVLSVDVSLKLLIV